MASSGLPSPSSWRNPIPFNDASPRRVSRPVVLYSDPFVNLVTCAHRLSLYFSQAESALVVFIPVVRRWTSSQLPTATICRLTRFPIGSAKTVLGRRRSTSLSAAQPVFIIGFRVGNCFHSTVIFGPRILYTVVCLICFCSPPQSLSSASDRFLTIPCHLRARCIPGRPS